MRQSQSPRVGPTSASERSGRREIMDGLSASRIAGIALGATVFLSIGGLLLRHRVIAPKPKPLADRPVATMIQSSTKGSD